jgi:hypothetical protein
MSCVSLFITMFPSEDAHIHDAELVQISTIFHTLQAALSPVQANLQAMWRSAALTGSSFFFFGKMLAWAGSICSRQTKRRCGEGDSSVKGNSRPRFARIVRVYKAYS